MNLSEGLLSIGQVSEICHVSIKTLRYYDKIGLLKPAYVDSVSKYRYYAKSQLALISLFKGMKLLGFSSDELRGCFGNKDIAPEKVVALLDKKIAQVNEQLEELQTVKQQLTLAKQAYKQQVDRQPGNIMIKHIPARLVVFMKSRLKHEFHPVTALSIEMANLARENNLVFKSGMMTIFHDNYQVFKHKEGELEVCCEIFPNESYQYSFIREIPSGLYASIIHEGDNLKLFSESYPKLYEWIKLHKYEPAGPAVNVYLDVPDGSTPKKATIEIQLPIKENP